MRFLVLLSLMLLAEVEWSTASPSDERLIEIPCNPASCLRECNIKDFIRGSCVEGKCVCDGPACPNNPDSCKIICKNIRNLPYGGCLKNHCVCKPYDCPKNPESCIKYCNGRGFRDGSCGDICICKGNDSCPKDRKLCNETCIRGGKKGGNCRKNDCECF